MAQNQDLHYFVDQLLTERQVGDLDPEVLDQMKSDLYSRVEDHINAAVLTNLPENKLAEFNKLLDTASPQEIQEFAHSNIANLDQIVAATLASFRKTYLGL